MTFLLTGRYAIVSYTFLSVFFFNFVRCNSKLSIHFYFENCSQTSLTFPFCLNCQFYMKNSSHFLKTKTKVSSEQHKKVHKTLCTHYHHHRCGERFFQGNTEYCQLSLFYIYSASFSQQTLKNFPLCCSQPRIKHFSIHAKANKTFQPFFNNEMYCKNK